MKPGKEWSAPLCQPPALQIVNATKQRGREDPAVAIPVARRRRGERGEGGERQDGRAEDTPLARELEELAEDAKRGACGRALL